jgi:5-methylcytosine-specific restriction protein A
VFDLVALDDELAAPTTAEEATTSSGDTRWTMPLDQLRTRSARNLGEPPTSTVAKRNVYQRSGDLKIYVLRRANGVCEGCEQPAPFRTRAGHAYLEPHHTRRLSDGGPDDYHHVIALCPTCHRRVHHGEDGTAYNGALVTRLSDIEPA